MNQDGIDVRPIVQITGTSEFNEVFFDDVEVPGGAIGHEDQPVSGIRRGRAIVVTGSTPGSATASAAMIT